MLLVLPVLLVLLVLLVLSSVDRSDDFSAGRAGVAALEWPYGCVRAVYGCVRLCTAVYGRVRPKRGKRAKRAILQLPQNPRTLSLWPLTLKHLLYNLQLLVSSIVSTDFFALDLNSCGKAKSPQLAHGTADETGRWATCQQHRSFGSLQAIASFHKSMQILVCLFLSDQC